MTVRNSGRQWSRTYHDSNRDIAKVRVVAELFPRMYVGDMKLVRGQRNAWGATYLNELDLDAQDRIAKGHRGVCPSG